MAGKTKKEKTTANDNNDSSNNKRRKLVKKPQKKTSETDNSPKPYDEIEDTEAKSERIQKLLEPYSKDQLIDFLCEAAAKDSSILERVRSIADQDVSHRKIFVHGLSWDTTRETLLAAFDSYGEIEDCKLVVDRVTGKAKGYGFVLFKSRTSAAKALKEPQKKINNRFAACQLASIGPGPAQQQNDTTGRKVYVSNVHPNADPEKLRAMFAKYGEIENGPMGFDVQTGKSRGFALFLYKTQEGARKSLEEPYKLFEGHQLHCQLASKPTQQQQQQQQQLPQMQQPMQASMLAAAAAAQNLALFSQHPGLNPAYSGLFMNPSAGLMAGALNPLFQAGINSGTIQSGQFAGTSTGNSLGLGGYSASPGMGLLGSGSSVGGGLLGSGSSMGGGLLGGGSSMGGYTPSYMNPSLQGLQMDQDSQHYLGQASSSRTNAFGGSLTGHPSYM